MVCFAKEELPKLRELYDRGVANGVPDMELLTGAQLAFCIMISSMLSSSSGCRAAVLQGVERVVRDAQDVRALFPHVDAEYAALLVQLAENVCSHVSLPVI